MGRFPVRKSQGERRQEKKDGRSHFKEKGHENNIPGKWEENSEQKDADMTLLS